MKLIHPYIWITVSIIATLAVIFLFAGVYHLTGTLEELSHNSWLLNMNNIVMSAVWVMAVFFIFRKLDRGFTPAPFLKESWNLKQSSAG